MPKLILSMDGLVLREIILDRERLTIGRKPSNDVQIDNLAISGRHALVTTILDDAFLEDLNSTNGTYVNGQPIRKHVLSDGDLIDLGKYRLKFIADRSAPRLARDELIQTSALVSVVSPADEVATPASGAPGDERTCVLSPPAPELQSPALIQVLTGVQAGRELELHKPVTTLGKPGGQAAVITRRGDAYYLTHVEGDSPPRVNGAPIGARARELHEQDVIEVAGVRMVFFRR